MPATNRGAPAILVLDKRENFRELLRRMENIEDACSLAFVSGFRWERDLTPLAGAGNEKGGC